MGREIECFGAKGDLLFKKDGAMAALSDVLTSVDGEFKDTDVGKTIVVNGAGASGAPLVTTIVSREFATQVTLADDASTPVGPPSSNPPAIYYYGTDDTEAFQKAIDESNINNGGVIELGNRGYLITAELTLPGRVINQQQVALIEFKGAVGPIRSNWNNVDQVVGGLNDVELPITGQTIIQLATEIAGTKMFDVDWSVQPSGIPSGIQVLFQNIVFRVPAVSNVTGLDLSHAYSCRIIDVTVEPSDHQSNLPPTSSGSIGINLPRIGNGAQVVLDRVGVAGFNIGIRFSEHTELRDIWLYRCTYALVADPSNHASWGGRVVTHACPNSLVVDDATTTPAYLTIDQLNIEDSLVSGGHWTAPLSHIYDPNNRLKGTIRHHKAVGFVGQEDGITKIGGANLVTQQIGRRLPDGGVKVATGLAQPSFTAALTSPVGESIPAESNTEQEWMLRAGVSMEVLNASGVYFSDGDGTCVARLEAPYENYSIVVNVDIDATQTRCKAGLCLKYIQGGTGPVGGTYIAATIEILPASSINRLRLFKVTNGTEDDLDIDTSVTFLADHFYTLRVDYENGTIEVFVDGDLKITAALSPADIALFGHSRQFGLYSYIGAANDRLTQWRTFTAGAI